MLQQPMKVTTATWAAGLVTVTFTNPIPGPPIVGDTIELVFSGFQPIGPGYNGLYVCTVTGPNTVTYAVTTSPGATTVVGTAQWYSAIELSQMATVLFLLPRGNMTDVWVLETWL